MADEFTQGSLVDVTVTFTDTNDAPADPTTIAFTYRVGSIVPVTADYSGANTEAVGVVWRSALGVYHYRLDTTEIVGTLDYAFAGAGAIQAVAVGQIVIYPNVAGIRDNS